MKFKIKSESWQFTFIGHMVLLPRATIELDTDELGKDHLNYIKKLIEYNKLSSVPEYHVVYSYATKPAETNSNVSEIDTNQPPQISALPNNSLVILDDGMYSKDYSKEITSLVNSNYQNQINNLEKQTKYNRTETEVVKTNLNTMNQEVTKLGTRVLDLEAIELPDINTLQTQMNSTTQLLGLVEKNVNDMSGVLNTLTVSTSTHSHFKYITTGEITTPLKTFYGSTISDKNGGWSIDYSSAGFKEIFNIQATAVAVGDAAGDRRLVTIVKESVTSCSGTSISATAAGALVAMALVNESAKVYITVTGV